MTNLDKLLGQFLTENYSIISTELKVFQVRGCFPGATFNYISSIYRLNSLSLLHSTNKELHPKSHHVAF